MGRLAAQAPRGVPTTEELGRHPHCAWRRSQTPGTIFRDREELASPTDLGTVINEALQQSACQIVICSPQSAKSRWVNEEIIAFKRLGREDRIFCLIVAGEPNATDQPGAAEEECFAPALRFRLGADGQLSGARTEPIAADARAVTARRPRVAGQRRTVDCGCQREPRARICSARPGNRSVARSTEE
jgi:hypothetical protein